MNKSLFFRDQNYCGNFKEYDGLLSHNSREYANQSFDTQSRARSKSDYNQTNLMTNQRNYGHNFMMNGNNLNYSNCSTHPNEKDNFFNYRG